MGCSPAKTVYDMLTHTTLLISKMDAIKYIFEKPFCDTVAEPELFWNVGLCFAFVFAKCRGKQESPPNFILSNRKGQKYRKIPFSRF